MIPSAEIGLKDELKGTKRVTKEIYMEILSNIDDDHYFISRCMIFLTINYKLMFIE